MGVIRKVYMKYGRRRDCVQFIDPGDINVKKNYFRSECFSYIENKFINYKRKYLDL